jgi:hypothetical protein
LPHAPDRIEALAATLIEDADEIDDRVDALHRIGDRAFMTDVGADGHDLGDIAQRLQEQGFVRPAHGDAHDPALLGQPLDDVAADESRSAEDCCYGCGHVPSSLRGFCYPTMRPDGNSRAWRDDHRLFLPPPRRRRKRRG